MPRSPRPWESWQLNSEFFGELARWTIDHPESSIDRILDRICTAIDGRQDLINIIPNSTFPARSLVQALAQLIKVGTVISKAKEDVQAFAKEIVHWVSEVASTSNHEEGEFTMEALKHLEGIRDLVDQICEWATKRLNDNYLKRIRHARTIGNDISKFKSRFAAGTQLFMQLPTINAAQGNDTILDHTEQYSNSHNPDIVPLALDPTVPVIKNPSVLPTATPKASKKQFKRLPIHSAGKEEELKVLHCSFVMCEFSSLQDAVSATWDLIDLAQSTGADVKGLLEVVKIASVFIEAVVEAVENPVGEGSAEYESSVAEFVSELNTVSQELQVLAQKPLNGQARDAEYDKTVVDRCKLQLQTVISTIKTKCPRLAHRAKSDRADTSDDSTSFVLSITIGILTILKEAAGIAPVPFLKGAVGTVLSLVGRAQDTRTNRQDMLGVANTAADFIASVWEASERSPQNLRLQSAITTFTSALDNIASEILALSKTPLLRRFLVQENDKEKIAGCKEELQKAINDFQITTQILQQETLDAILSGQDKILAGQEEIRYITLLEKLPRPSITFDDQEYLASTRRYTLAKIVQWIENPAPENRVFWLHGATGMGKSTIARYLRKTLGDAGRLAAYFFFKRGSKDQERPDFVIGTLAYQLAHIEQRLKSAICNVIRNPPSDQLFPSQFKAFILNSLQAASFSLPIVIIIDALDEYNDALKFLDVLVEFIPQFPSNIKVLLTSRHEPDIESRISKLGPETLELRSASTRAMTALFEERLRAIQGWQIDHPTPDQISQLVGLADGLFGWASAACNLIANPLLRPPDHILNEILSPQSDYRRASENHLDDLYIAALRHLFPKLRPDLHAENFQRVFRAVFVIKHPLTVEDLQTLLGDTVNVNSVISALRGLQTQVTSDVTSDTPVTPSTQRFHASFLDFIDNPQRCTDDRFRVDPPKSHAALAEACFRLMDHFFHPEQPLLRSETSDTQISDIHRYAIRNWAVHVCNANMTDELRDAAAGFCERHFVQWFQIQIQSVIEDVQAREDMMAFVLDGQDASDRLNMFGVVFLTHGGHLKGNNIIDTAISVQDVAVRITVADHPKRANHLDNFGRLLTRRYNLTGQLADIDKAVRSHREALVLRSAHDPDRWRSLYNLTVALAARFRQLRHVPDLVEGIMICRQSFRELALGYPGHPTSCTVLITRGEMLIDLYMCTKQSSDLEEALAAFHDGVQYELAPTSERYRSARLWAHHADSHDRPALEAYQTSVRLLSRISMFESDLQTHEPTLPSGGGLGCNAAACAIRSGELGLAVELLEGARQSVWSQTLRFRAQLEKLAAVAPAHLQSLKRISHALEYDVLQRMMPTSEELTHCARLSQAWLLALEEVRRLDGLQDFLQPTSFTKLQGAAANGPVVILNASEYGCDALVMSSTGVNHVPLPEFTLTIAKELAISFRRSDHGWTECTTPVSIPEPDLIHQYFSRHTAALLRRLRRPQLSPDWLRYLPSTALVLLWSSVVKLIIQTLGLEKSDTPPRLWWCPTGPFAFLPIHAAGIYRDNEHECVSDYVVSSYSPTLSTLLVPPPTPGAFKMLAAIQPTSPGSEILPGTLLELDRITEHVPNEFLVRLGISGAPARIDDFCTHLSTASIVHVACHAKQDENNPLESALLLEDGRLNVCRLIKEPLPNALLIFFSACETARGSESLPDEAIHIAAAALSAGFRQAIATMWFIVDNDGPIIADSFYKALFPPKEDSAEDAPHPYPDMSQAARALHLAVADLRARGVPFGRWVPFIHLGL